VVLVVAARAGLAARAAGPTGYVNPNVPEVKLPAYAGQRHEAVVPDTLDLAERAKYRHNAAPRRKVKRLVADQQLAW